MHDTFTRLPLGTVRLLPVVNRPGSTPSFYQRAELNRKYVMSLANEHLLQNHYLEAGLWHTRGKPEGIHWGWESPTCQVRGHFLGHWLSAAARIWASTGDFEVKAKADRIVSELGRCQRENGGEWVFPIPEKYLHWVARGKTVWAPQYVVHKTLMGLYDMVAFAQNEQALDIMAKAATWFHRWTGQFSREELDDILDVETGGMLEAWADLYGATGREEHLDLVQRYDRPRLFDRLLAGEDALTNKHANTTIPEAHGAARAWEVTGERRWRDIAFAYWDQAVTRRGSYATGGQNCGEFWTAPNELSARLGSKTQEHCTVYNMMRLAEYLLRWTGDVQYADYWERNLYNGILAQQHPTTGMISYFLPMNPGATKEQTKLPRMEKTYWGSPTDDFWCCHGSLVQAHSAHGASAYFEDEEGLILAQYIPTELSWEWQGVPVKVTQTFDPQLDKPRRPECLAFDVAVEAERAGRVHAEDSPSLVAAGRANHRRQRHAGGGRALAVELLEHPPHLAAGQASRRVAQGPDDVPSARQAGHGGLHGWAGRACRALRRGANPVRRPGPARDHPGPGQRAGVACLATRLSDAEPGPRDPLPAPLRDRRRALHGLLPSGEGRRGDSPL